MEAMMQSSLAACDSGMQTLIEKCLKCMIFRIDETNVLKYLKLGIRYRQLGLVNECLDKLCELLPDVNFMERNTIGEWEPLHPNFIYSIVKNFPRPPSLEDTLFLKDSFLPRKLKH